MSGAPLLLYIPGLLPKPEPERHREALYRCLLTGVRQADANVADAIDAQDRSFDLVSWTFDFYREHRDIALDVAAIEQVIAQPVASERDRAEADSWQRRLTRFLYQLGDRLPFLIPHLASERTEVHLRDLRRYLNNKNDIAEHTREMLKLPLRAASEAGRPILLLAHSMGSVIAWDALWQMTHEHHDRVNVDLLVTMGSPLGQNFLQKRIKGSDRSGAERFPHAVRRWVNIAAVGDLTALDPHLQNDFADMTRGGLVDSIEDVEIFNSYRLDGELNTHAEYGYLANAETGRIVADWWKERVEPRFPAGENPGSTQAG